jgi:hypothetical protein
MLSLRALAFSALLALAGSAFAQDAQPPDRAKAMKGTWEISNADRDKICMVTFAPVPAPGGLKLEFDKACDEAFELTRDIGAWRIDKDGLHFVDAKGRALLDLDEVESGIFEGVRPGEGRYFIQSLASVRAEPTPEQIFGDWAVSRGSDQPICVITFSNRSLAGSFALEVKPGCGALVTGFNPTSWRMERGELVVSSARGAWRFEEAGQIAWRRVPEGTDPLWLVRQMDNPPAGGGG